MPKVGRGEDQIEDIDLAVLVQVGQRVLALKARANVGDVEDVDPPIGIDVAAQERDLGEDPLREARLVRTAEDLGIDARKVDRSWLAAQSLEDLVEISKGLYHVPESLRVGG